MSYASFLLSLVPTSLRRTRWALYLQGLGDSIDGSTDGVIKDASGTPMTQHFDDQANAMATGAPDPDFGITARAKLAVKTRFPDNPVGATATPTDAIDAIGGDRLLERGNSGDQAFATRLRKAWTIWSFGGTAYGLLCELWNQGYHNVHVQIVNGNSYTLQSNTGDPATDLVITSLMPQSWWPSGVVGPPARTWWTRFTVLFDSPLPTIVGTNAPSDWTSALPAADSDEVNTIRRLIARWKPAYAICDRIIVVTTAPVWDWPVTTTWNQAGLKWGDGAATYWTP